MKYERTKEDYRKIYVDHFGEIPSGYHIHHIDGDCHNNSPGNLVALSPEEHYDIHFERGDLGACALLSAGIDRDAPTTPVVAFDLDGYRIRRFDGQTEANSYVNGAGTNGAINLCCEYKQKSYMGCQWFYESEVGDIDYIGPVKRNSNLIRGHSTLKKMYIDVTDLTLHKSQSKATKHARPDLKKNSAGECKWFKDRFMEITKEEYEVFKSN